MGLVAGSVKGGGLAGLRSAGAAVPGSLSRGLGPGAGQEHTCQRPECAQGATEGRDKANTSAEEGVLIGAGAPMAESGSPKSSTS